ncbi:Uncharacterized protein AB751O23_BP_00070 [Chlamydiales bacterium SCGC AB-751-O23]|jgi:AMP nucleosidase|nr:Uncharacterized protein AB751O23_BP_00070 [Chlamydiales bacterium SCGC AB-751-O23]
MVDFHQEKIAKDTLERYSGCEVKDFCSHLILTNFPKYVDYFCESRGVESHEGLMFRVAHSKEEDVSIIDFRIGSPAAALVVDLCSFLPVKASIFLGMCGGLRDDYKVGDYFLPVACIRSDGTSNSYFPKEVPAMSNFFIQKEASNVLQESGIPFHLGIAFTTNVRFWEFNEPFKKRLEENRAQVIEMECATLFIVGYKRRFPIGALLLVSDLPLNPSGIKTKASSKEVFERCTKDHVEKGVRIIKTFTDKLAID